MNANWTTGRVITKNAPSEPFTAAVGAGWFARKLLQHLPTSDTGEATLARTTTMID